VVGVTVPAAWCCPECGASANVAPDVHNCRQQTTQETAAEVIVSAWDQQVHDGTPSDWLAGFVLAALAAAEWSVVKLEPVGEQDYEGWYVGTVTSGQPAYVVTAGRGVYRRPTAGGLERELTGPAMGLHAP
jgi:hypothetical protein